MEVGVFVCLSSSFILVYLAHVNVSSFEAAMLYYFSIQNSCSSEFTISISSTRARDIIRGKR